MKLSIIVVDYNSSKYIVPCLNSIKQFLSGIEFEVIIVDNCSPENHGEEYKQILSNVKYFRLDQNLGFGGGNNYGAKQASGDYLLLLNPDTLLVDDSVQKMVSFLDFHDEIGALTCLLYNDEKTMQKNFFGKFQSLGSLVLRHYNYQKIDQSKEFFYTDIVTGAAFMIKKERFLQAGGFDEKIFMYLEDDDLCKTLVDLGYKNAVLNTARIIHLEGKSAAARQRKIYYYESQDYYWRKHNGIFAALIMKIIRYPYKLLVLLRSKSK